MNEIFTVEGMTCGSCALRVARALRKRGARKVRVDLVQEVVTLQRDPATTGDAAIRDAPPILSANIRLRCSGIAVPG